MAMILMAAVVQSILYGVVIAMPGDKERIPMLPQINWYVGAPMQQQTKLALE